MTPPILTMFHSPLSPPFIFTKTFCCCSHECLYGEAGTAELIDLFQLGTDDDMPCLGKIAPYLGETCFSILLIIAL